MTVIEYMWHIAKYSVFGVKISTKQYPEPIEVIGVNVRNLEFETSLGRIVPMDFTEVRLYLYPLSCLTGDDYVRFEAWSKPPIASGPESRVRFLERMNNLEELLCSRHIDYLGLIQVGLAVDATGKGIYGNME